MPTLKEAAQDFLAQRRIAVVGVSRNPKGHGANIVYKRLRDRGYEVFAVNANADEVEGDQCFRDLKTIPGGVDAVVVGTAPEATDSVVQQCAELGISRVWIHRSFGEGSVPHSGAEHCGDAGVTCIAGGCPLMFKPAADVGHRVMKGMLGLGGKLPKQV